MENTQTPQSALASLTADDVYDAIMGDIDMDLITVNLPTLEEKYKNETPEERVARQKRYQEAYAKYDKAFEEWSMQMNSAVTTYRHNALASAEKKSKEEEAKDLANIESQFGS
jgi:hypothetical protein